MKKYFLHLLLIGLLFNSCKKTTNTDRIPCFTFSGPAGGTNQNVFKVGDTIQFTNCSGRTYTGFRWSFGDGGTSNERDPKYSWNKEGEYLITMQGLYKGAAINIEAPWANAYIIIQPN